MKNALFSLLAIAAVSSISTAAAEEYSKRPFDATYTSVTPSGSTTLRIASDGRGKYVTETTSQGQVIRSVVNYIDHTSFTVMPAQKMVIKGPFKAMEGAFDPDMARKKNAKNLGVKVVEGHPAQGWLYTADGGTTEVWVGNDINQFVKSTTKSPSGNVTTTLKTFAARGPAPDVFAMPSGYQVMDTSTMGR